MSCCDGEPISNITDTYVLSGSELFAFVQDGVTRQGPLSSFTDFFVNGIVPVSVLNSYRINWDNTYNITTAVSSIWEETLYHVNVYSVKWSSAADTVDMYILDWNDDKHVINEFQAASGEWTNTQTTVQLNSATWAIDFENDAQNLNYDNWDSVYTTVNINSADWEYADTQDSVLQGASGIWDSAYTTVNSNSSNWQSAYSVLSCQNFDDAFITAKISSSTITTTGIVKRFRIPYSVNLAGVRASVKGPGITGGALIIDIKASGQSILDPSARLVIDNATASSVDANQQPIITRTNISDDEEVVIEILQIGNGVDDLHVTIIGNRLGCYGDQPSLPDANRLNAFKEFVRGYERNPGGNLTQSSGPWTVGDVLEYKTTVTNVGGGVVQDTLFTDSFDSIDIIQDTDGLANGTLDLATDQTTNIIYQYTITQANVDAAVNNNTPLINTATIESANLTDVESNTVSINANKFVTPANVNIIKEIDVQATGTGTGAIGHRAGDEIVYNVYVTNTGGQLFKGDVLSDTLSPITVLSDPNNMFNPGPSGLNVAGNTTLSASYKYIVTEADIAAFEASNDPIINTAFVTEDAGITIYSNNVQFDALDPAALFPTSGIVRFEMQPLVRRTQQGDQDLSLEFGHTTDEQFANKDFQDQPYTPSEPEGKYFPMTFDAPGRFKSNNYNNFIVETEAFDTQIGNGMYWAVRDENNIYQESLGGPPTTPNVYNSIFKLANANSSMRLPITGTGDWLDNGLDTSFGYLCGWDIVHPQSWVTASTVNQIISTGGLGKPTLFDKTGLDNLYPDLLKVEPEPEFTAYHSGYAAVGDKHYVVGGRYGARPVYIYDRPTNRWSTGAMAPTELHHYQAVELNGLIYVVCAWKGGYPNEQNIDNVYIYNPEDDSWAVGPVIPSNRNRGASSAVAYNNKIYVMGGEDGGHTGSGAGVVAWLDEFDPNTGTWTQLADAPRIRDHHQAAIVNDKMYVIGGRDTATSLNAVIQPVDVYDFNTSSWSTIPTLLPTGRAGCAVIAFEGEIYVIGGESSQTPAYDEVEALNPVNNTWRTLPKLNLGRQGIQAVVNANSIYVIAGSKLRGESSIYRSDKAFQEVFTIKVDNELTHESLLRSTGEFWIYPAENGTPNNPNLITPSLNGFKNIKFEKGGYRTPERIFVAICNESEPTSPEVMESEWNLLRHTHPVSPFYLITDYSKYYIESNPGFEFGPNPDEHLRIPQKFHKDPLAFVYDIYDEDDTQIDTPTGVKSVHRLFYAWGFDKYAYGSRIHIWIDNSGSFTSSDFLSPTGRFNKQWQRFRQDCTANGLEIVSIATNGDERWPHWFHSNVDGTGEIINNPTDIVTPSPPYPGELKANIIGSI